MTLLSPRPRFHVLLWSQLFGALMVVSGMFPYWINVDGAWVPDTVKWRAWAATGVLFLMFIVPYFLNFRDSVFSGFQEGKTADKEERLANDRKIVRTLIWIYCGFDLLLLTYLIHITGGLTDSMYSSLYLLIPSLALLVMLGSEDLGYVPWLIALAMAGIAFAFWMCNSPDRIEYNAAHHHAAFCLATALVSWEAAILLIVQVSILKRQMAT